MKLTSLGLFMIRLNTAPVDLHSSHELNRTS